jgi:hypothetical protein|tara:strand:+ start:646 stop:822 length:177 start_codon:yes stop_codon:yes gene_type:complete
MTQAEQYLLDWMDKHKVKPYVAEDNGQTYYPCAGFKYYDAVNLVIEMHKLLETNRIAT